MRKTITIMLTVALFGILAAAVVARGGGVTSTSDPTEATETTQTATTETAPERTTTTEADVDGAEDVSGPCDEAEHAGDRRCTGTGAEVRRGDDDRRGHDRGGDNSGPGSDNSGPGSDNSGPGSADSGRGDDDFDDDFDDDDFDDDDFDDDDSSGSGSGNDGG